MAASDRSQQDALLRRRLSGDIFDLSDFHRARLVRAGIGKNGVRRTNDLTRLPPMTLADVRSPATLLLRSGSVPKRAGEAHQHWPLQWIQSGGVPIGYSARDIGLLGDLGRQLLEAAGLVRSDVFVNLLPPGTSRDYWQLLLGAQRAGLSAYAPGPGASPKDIDLLCPTVVAGEIKELLRILDAAHSDGSLDRVHTAIVVGEPPTERQNKKLLDRLGGHEGSIVRAWAPDGVLALWGQCRGGTGFHTWPLAEVVELVDPVSGIATPPGRAGHLVWTGIGWYGSAIVRLQTASPMALVEGQCPTCGRTSPRLEAVDSAPGFSGVLNENEHVLSWAAELVRNQSGEELVIWVVLDDPAYSLMLLQELGDGIGPARVVIVEQAELDQRLTEAKGERFGDRRALLEDA